MGLVIKIEPQFEQLRPVIEDVARHGMPSGAEVIYDERNRLFALPTSEGDIVVKSFHVPSAVNAVAYTTVRRSKARRSYEHARSLIALGFDTPAPIAYIERRKGLSLRESYYICRRLAPCHTMRDWSAKPDIGPILDALAREMVRLHHSGVHVRDFSPGNILLTGSREEGYRFHYVDLNRMSFNVFDHKKLMSCFRCITLDLTEALDLAARYARAAHLDHDTVVAEATANFRSYQRLQRRKRLLKRLRQRLLHRRG